MKKILALVIAILTFCAMLPASALSFPDIDASHWAFAAVSELVAKGTIKGFTDGTFKPVNTVSRAEFVKMVGAGTNKRAKEYKDVDKTHWAYNEIITSGLSSDDRNNFNPTKPITRANTVEVLYKRYGKAGMKAPEFITNQGKDFLLSKDALAWIYSTGILIGADGINLRLGDTLTRAEAAVLIAKCSKAKTVKNFVDLMSDDVLKSVMKAHPIFEEGYTLGDVLTNAQLAEAMIKFSNDSASADTSNYYIGSSINHEKSAPLYIMCKSNIGMDNFTVEFANANATVATAEKAVKNAAERIYSGAIVNDAFLYTTEAKKENSPVTCRDVLALILQYDIMVGTSFAYTTEKVGDYYTSVNTKARYDATKNPYNYGQFVVVLEEVPNEVYHSVPATENPAKIYDFAREYAPLFLAKCERYVMAAKQGFGIDMKITYYPSLVYRNEKGFYFKVKVTALNSTNYTPKDLFEGAITNRDKKLKAGTEFFTEIYVESIV